MRVLLLLVSTIIVYGQYYSVPAAPFTGPDAGLHVARIGNESNPATLATISNPQSHFHVYYPIYGSVCSREKTTDQAKRNKCVFATNGGPFRFHPVNNTSGDCVGPLISDGKTVSTTAGSAFGLTQQGMFVLGEVRVEIVYPTIYCV
jgi:exopolysaccharide biosynthesis protein